LNWWRYDTNLTTRAEAENMELRVRLSELEQEIRNLAAASLAAATLEQADNQKSERRAKAKRRNR
jgi:hypothetical protein